MPKTSKVRSTAFEIAKTRVARRKAEQKILLAKEREKTRMVEMEAKESTRKKKKGGFFGPKTSERAKSIAKGARGFAQTLGDIAVRAETNRAGRRTQAKPRRRRMVKRQVSSSTVVLPSGQVITIQQPSRMKKMVKRRKRRKQQPKKRGLDSLFDFS